MKKPKTKLTKYVKSWVRTLLYEAILEYMNDRTRWLLWMERLKINWRSSLFQNFGSFHQTTILAEWLVGLRSVRYEKYCDFRFWLRPILVLILQLQMVWK